jgi:hypothetical protein
VYWGISVVSKSSVEIESPKIADDFPHTEKLENKQEIDEISVNVELHHDDV